MDIGSPLRSVGLPDSAPDHHFRYHTIVLRLWQSQIRKCLSPGSLYYALLGCPLFPDLLLF
jgi:hypothetical protein